MRTMAAVTAWRDAFIERLKATGNVTLAATRGRRDPSERIPDT